MAKHNYTSVRSSLCVGVLIIACTAWAGVLEDRPGHDYRTITTDQYQVVVLKNGGVNVSFVSGDPIFTNVFPMIWVDGESEPRPMDVAWARYSARYLVNNRIGPGQAMLFIKGNCEWVIQAYPAKSYLSAQVAFINTTKKPVKVRTLIPWAVGAPGKGMLSLGPGTENAALLTNGALADIAAHLTHVSDGACQTGPRHP